MSTSFQLLLPLIPKFFFFHLHFYHYRVCTQLYPKQFNHIFLAFTQPNLTLLCATLQTITPPNIYLDHRSNLYPIASDFPHPPTMQNE